MRPRPSPVLAATRLPGRGELLALGMGLDRLLMLVKHRPDIRCSAAAIPDHPPDARPRQIPARLADAPDHPDLSVAVWQDEVEEALRRPGPRCPRRRRELCRGGPGTPGTPCWQLPASAISRLGAKPGRRTSSCASSSGIWKRHSQTRPPTPSATRSTRRFTKGRNTNAPDDPRSRRLP